MDAKFDSTSKEYPHCILLMDPSTPKTRNTWKNVMTPLPQKKEIPKKMWFISFFQVLLFLGVEHSIRSMQCGYSLDAESNSASNKLSRSKFEKKTQGDMLKIRTKKVVFFLLTNMSIQPLWLTHFIEILLVLEF